MPISGSEIKEGAGGHPALEVLQATAAYGSREVLRGIDLVMQPGERVALLGPNGAGKSTLLSLIATLHLPVSGTIRVDGYDVRSQVAPVRERVGIVFQGTSLDRKLTAEENLRFIGRLYGLSGSLLSQRIDETIERVGLGSRRHDRVATLSGGLARRVEIARAFLHRPPLLLLDEPTSGLDPTVRGEIWDYLKTLSQDGTAILTATHFGEEADQSNRVMLLAEGKTVTEGTPDELRARVGGEVVVVECQDPDGIGNEIQSLWQLASKVVDGALWIERENAHEFIPRLVETFPGRFRSVTLRRPTLEDAFVHFTGAPFMAERADA
jgi:ABC-2 type transport system ATP-binding protein